MNRKVVGIMGGHAVSRGESAYRNAAALARRLSQKDYLVASGGGPGIMEAAHVGAFHAQADDASFAASLAHLAKEPAFPDDAGSLVDRKGAFLASITAELAAWLAPALDILDVVKNPSDSLGIPTWRYGHEPTTPFATRIAKYFENSVREDGLLSIARNGVVYAQGGAGTLQEIFQDAVFNAYFDDELPPSPMIFFGRDYWTGMAVIPVLKALFGPKDFDAFVSITDDSDEVIATLDAFAAMKHSPSGAQHAGLALSNPVLQIDRLEPDGGMEWQV